MAALKMCLAVALAVLAVLLQQPAASHAKTPRGAGKGVRFFDWASKQLPEVALKLVSCAKKNEREVRESVGNVFSDVGKCFDDARGSLLATTECMLQNGVLHLQGAISVTHRLLGCTFQKQKSDFRLCLTATTASDDTCPFAVGI